MIEIMQWMDVFVRNLNRVFDRRVWFVGLQGSYARGEAAESSDIDVVVILDKLEMEDIRTYRAMLDTLPYRELICGFLSGKTEIFHWDPSDLFQFYYDTVPVQGNLDELLTQLDGQAVRRAIKTGACNLYHGCLHNMLHEQSADILKGLYKSAAFVIQAVWFRQTGQYLRHRQELMEAVGPEERKLLSGLQAIRRGAEIPFDAMSERLLLWTKHWIEESA